MKIVIECDAQEIAALVVGLQERQGLAFDDASLSNAVKCLQESQDQARQAYLHQGDSIRERCQTQADPEKNMVEVIKRKEGNYGDGQRKRNRPQFGGGQGLQRDCCTKKAQRKGSYYILV